MCLAVLGIRLVLQINCRRDYILFLITDILWYHVITHLSSNVKGGNQDICSPAILTGFDGYTSDSNPLSRFIVQESSQRIVWSSNCWFEALTIIVTGLLSIAPSKTLSRNDLYCVMWNIVRLYRIALSKSEHDFKKSNVFNSKTKAV